MRLHVDHQLINDLNSNLSGGIIFLVQVTFGDHELASNLLKISVHDLGVLLKSDPLIVEIRALLL